MSIEKKLSNPQINSEENLTSEPLKNRTYHNILKESERPGIAPDKVLNFGEICFYKEDRFFKKKEQKYPIIKDEDVVSEKETILIPPKGTAESYGFGYIQKERVIPKTYTEFFSNFIRDGHFHGEKVIYFTKEGDFSDVPTSDFVVLIDKPNYSDKERKIEGTFQAVSSIIKNYSENNDFNFEQLEFDYIKSLLKKESFYYGGFMEKEDSTGFEKYYRNVRLEGDKVIADVVIYESEDDAEGELCDKNVELDMNETIRALSSNRIMGTRLVKEITEILSKYDDN